MASLAAFFRREETLMPPLNLNTLLTELTLGDRHPIVVQIGAFDGCTGDPLVEFLETHKARAVLLEPQPAPFAALQARYANRVDVVTVNAAVAATDGRCTLHVVDGTESADPWWCGQIASFSREHLLRHADRIPNLTNRICAIDVATMSPESLMRNYAIPQIDALIVDTEGADWEIVKLFLDRNVIPSVLFFEWRHLDPPTIATAVTRLAELGFQTEFVEADIIAQHIPAIRRTIGR